MAKSKITDIGIFTSTNDDYQGVDVEVWRDGSLWAEYTNLSLASALRVSRVQRHLIRDIINRRQQIEINRRAAELQAA